MAPADLWLVLITNQMACVVQGGRPPSSLKSHFLFIVLSLGPSVFFIACWRWFYLVPGDSMVSSSAGCREADSLRIWTLQNKVYLELHRTGEEKRMRHLCGKPNQDFKNIITQIDSCSETGRVHSPTYVVCSDQRCYTLILLLHVSICCTRPIALPQARHIRTQAHTLKYIFTQAEAKALINK